MLTVATKALNSPNIEPTFANCWKLEVHMLQTLIY